MDPGWSFPVATSLTFFLKQPPSIPASSGSRVAPPKAVPPPRVKAANHRAVPDDNFVRDDWDDDIKTPCHGSPVSGSMDTGGLPAASVETKPTTGFDD